MFVFMPCFAWFSWIVLRACCADGGGWGWGGEGAWISIINGLLLFFHLISSFLKSFLAAAATVCLICFFRYLVRILSLTLFSFPNTSFFAAVR